MTADATRQPTEANTVRLKRDRAVRRTETAGEQANALKLTAYCGLYCGDCFWYGQKVMRLARALRREIRTSGFDQYARYAARLPGDGVYADFDTCWKVLGAMTRTGCGRACRDGGCSPSCSIRVCCISRKLDGCWQCARFESCPTLARLEPVHRGGHIRNLRVLKRKGPAGFVRGAHFWASLTRRGVAGADRNSPLL